MLDFIPLHPLLTCILVIVLGFIIFIQWEKHMDRLAERRSLAHIKAQAPKYNGNWPGGTEVLTGVNWQLICPDCGTFNVMHRPAGIACRHCGHELLITPNGWEGGTDEPMGVISRVSGASNNRVGWIKLSGKAPHNHPARRCWSPEVFQDIPSQAPLELNPPTDLDWEDVHPFMPIVCPACKGEALADCDDCRRTGIRFVPLTSWRADGVKRVSQSGIRYLRLAYAGRCDMSSEQGITAFNGLYLSGRGGWGALVMEGRRQPRSPLADEVQDIEAAKASDLTAAGQPLGPDPRIKREGDVVGKDHGMYQPLPRETGRAPSSPPKKQ